MNPHWLALHRREVLIGISALAAARPGIALGCHERDHPPCRVAALLPMTGPVAQIGQEAAAGIRAMSDQLQQTDPQSRGHLGVLVIDSASNPQVATTEVRRIVSSGGSSPGAVIVADTTLPLGLLAALGDELKIPMVSILTYPSDQPSQWVCRLSPSAAQIGAGMAAYLSSIQPGQPVNIVNTSLTAARTAEFASALAAVGQPAGARVTLPDPSGRDVTPLEAEVAKAVKLSGWIVSVPISAVAAIVGVIRRDQDGAPIVIDAGIADPVSILRAANAQKVLAVSIFDPDLVNRRPLAGAIDRRVREITGRPLAPAGAVAATAVQVLAQAVVTAKVRGDAYGEATRDSLRAVSLPADDLILPWDGIRFGPTFQNEGARVVALELQDNRAVKVWPPDTRRT